MLFFDASFPLTEVEILSVTKIFLLLIFLYCSKVVFSHLFESACASISVYILHTRVMYFLSYYMFKIKEKTRSHPITLA